ncbi:hypothetical protein [Candidatus Palauibacter sp.]|uniref:hypothetical protein n=1 Tax=Candidatus Palauibacter sp. TaxID=3101350 RepID=UPI003CC5B430
MRSSRLLGFLGAVVLIACGGEEAGPGVPFELKPLASTRLPTAFRGPTLISLDTACVVDQYRIRGYCVDVRGDTLVFGNQGEGPGELSNNMMVEVAGGPYGDITIADPHLYRISRFSAEGVFVSSASTGGITIGLQAMTDSTALTRHQARGDPVSANAEIHLETGEILRKWLPDPSVVTCRTPPGRGQSKIRGAYSAGTGIVHVACFGEFLLWYPSGVGEAVVIRSPTYRERFTSEEAIANIIRTRGNNPGGFDPGYAAEDYRARAYPWYGRAGADTKGRLWILRLREDEGSYVDVYDLVSASFSGTAELQGNVSTIDILGDRLIALRRSDGLTDDVVDWYELPED